MSSGINSQHTDAPWAPRGLGVPATWVCMGCNKHRGSTVGAKGKGVRRRCAPCVAAGEAKKAGRAAG